MNKVKYAINNNRSEKMPSDIYAPVSFWQMRARTMYYDGKKQSARGTLRLKVAMTITAIATISSIEPTAPILFSRPFYFTKAKQWEQNGRRKHGLNKRQTRLRMPAALYKNAGIKEFTKFLRCIDPARSTKHCTAAQACRGCYCNNCISIAIYRSNCELGRGEAPAGKVACAKT